MVPTAQAGKTLSEGARIALNGCAVVEGVYNSSVAMVLITIRSDSLNIEAG